MLPHHHRLAAERTGLLHDICESPFDDAPRLIYADWLEDNNSPRQAEFIRAQCELAVAFPGLPPYPHHVPRDFSNAYPAEVVRLFGQEALAYRVDFIEKCVPKRLEYLFFYSDEPYNCHWARGFPVPRVMDARMFVKHAQALFKSCPLTGVTVDEPPDRDKNDGYCWHNGRNYLGALPNSLWNVVAELFPDGLENDRVYFSSFKEAWHALQQAGLCFGRRKAGLSWPLVGFAPTLP